MNEAHTLINASLTEIKNIFNTLIASGQVKNIDAGNRLFVLYKEIEKAFYENAEMKRAFLKKADEIPT
jgi:hypothetical protein